MDGSQDFKIDAKIKTEAANGTIFVWGKAAPWGGAMWTDGGKNGQSKMLFLREGKLSFDIGWVGLITGMTNIADGNQHDIGLSYSMNDEKFRLTVDDEVEAYGLHAVPDNQ